MTLSQIYKSVTKGEWRFVTSLILVVIFITTIPLVYGFLTKSAGQVFTGIHFAAPNDWFVYYSHIKQVDQGNFLFKNLFTAEDQQPVLNIFWLGVGLLAKWFNLSAPIAFNLVRIFLIPIFYFVAYLFIAYLFSETKQRKVSILLLSFASGLGFLLIAQIVKYPFNFSGGVFHWPMDLWVPEAITFLTLYYSPHFIASLTLILLIFLLTVLFSENKKFIYSLAAGICALILFFFHPFHVLTVFGVIFVYFLVLVFRGKTLFWALLKHYLVLVLFSLPPVIYYLYFLSSDRVIMQKAIQNLCFTPPFLITLFSFGLLLVLAASGVYFLFKNNRIARPWLFVVIWAATQFFLIYFPVNYQRRLSEGLHFPLVALSAFGLFAAYKLMSEKKSQFLELRYTILIILILGLVSSNIFALAADLFIYSSQRGLAYLDQATVEAAVWLESVPADKIIFNSADNIINIIPAYAGRRVYAGHGVETPNFGQKQLEVNWFFSQNRPEEIEKKFLAKRKIDYIFYGPAEKSLGQYDPDIKSYLREVYSNSSVEIYERID